ncbi:O-antigen ligase family protein [Roseisolibacter agri]|nr:O-antigen ligase family protein [Roseisolibacter agri]
MPHTAGPLPETRRTSLLKAILGGVEFTPAYVGFLGYIFVITTLVVPIADVAMAVAVFSMLLPQPGGYRFPPTLRWLVALTAWCALGLTMTGHPGTVTEEVYALIKLCVIVFVAANVLRTRGQINFFLIFFLACYAFFPARAGLFAFLFYGGGRVAWQGLFGNPNDLAAMSLLALSMCLGLFFSARHTLLRLVSMAGVGVLSLVVLLTQSRGAMVAMFVFAFAAIVSTKGKQRLKLIYALAIAGVVGAYVAPKSVWDRFAGLANFGTETAQLKAVDPEGSAEQRWEIWKVARRITVENPILGVGWGAYPLEHAVYAQRPEFKRTARGARDTHSTLLNVVAETGFPGLVIFSGIFLSAVLFAERTRRAARRVLPEDATMLLYLELGLLAYFVAGIWGSYAKLSLTYVHTLVLWAYATMMMRTLRAQAGGVPYGAAAYGGVPSRAPLR